MQEKHTWLTWLKKICPGSCHEEDYIFFKKNNFTLFLNLFRL